MFIPFVLRRIVLVDTASQRNGSQASALLDKQDVALRGFVFWKRLNFRLMTAEAAVKRRTNRRSKQVREQLSERFGIGTRTVRDYLELPPYVQAA